MPKPPDTDWRWAVVEPTGAMGANRSFEVRVKVHSVWTAHEELAEASLAEYQQLMPGHPLGIMKLPARMLRRSRQIP